MNKAMQQAFSIVRERRVNAEVNKNATLKILRKDKTFVELENERDATAFKLSHLRYQNAPCGTLNSHYLEITEQLNQRIKELNYKPSDLEIKYVCKKCKDEGMVNGKDCACVKQIAFDILTRNCVGRSTAIDNFDEVDYTFYSEKDAPSIKLCLGWLKNYAKLFPTCKYNTVCLVGKVGTGKTFSVSVLANAVMRKGYSVVMLNAQQLNKIFLKYHLATLDSKEDIFEPLLSSDLLIIDDLGTEQIFNNVTINYLYEVIAERAGKPIIITTNLSPESVAERYSQRIYSRLIMSDTSFVLKFDGEDLRKRR